MPEVSKFTNCNGMRRLKGLFIEKCITPEEKKTALYTLKDNPHKGLPSLFRLYMEEYDPSEYNFAVKNLEDHKHWLLLCETAWFKPYVERWRYELDLSIQANAVAKLIKESQKDTREALSAAKFLIEKRLLLIDKPSNKGRPSKEEIAKNANRIAQDNHDLNDHMLRLGLIEGNVTTTS